MVQETSFRPVGWEVTLEMTPGIGPWVQASPGGHSAKQSEQARAGDIFPHHGITSRFHWGSPVRHYLRGCCLKDSSHKLQTCFSEAVHGRRPTLQRGGLSRASPTVDISLSSDAQLPWLTPALTSRPNSTEARKQHVGSFAQGQYHRVTHSQKFWIRRVSFLSLPTGSLEPCFSVAEATFPIPTPESSSEISRTLVVQIQRDGLPLLASKAYFPSDASSFHSGMVSFFSRDFAFYFYTSPHLQKGHQQNGNTCCERLLMAAFKDRFKSWSIHLKTTRRTLSGIGSK